MSALSPAADGLLRAGLAILRDDGPAFLAAFRAHDWKRLAFGVVEAELKLAAAAPGPQQGAANVALKLLPVGLAVLALRRAPPASLRSRKVPAMSRGSKR